MNDTVRHYATAEGKTAGPIAEADGRRIPIAAHRPLTPSRSRNQIGTAEMYPRSRAASIIERRLANGNGA